MTPSMHGQRGEVGGRGSFRSRGAGGRNLALFILIPFAYLFTESEGFLGSKVLIIDREEAIHKLCNAKMGHF